MLDRPDPRDGVRVTPVVLVLLSIAAASVARAGDTPRATATAAVSAAAVGEAAAAMPFAGIVLEDPDERRWELSALAGHPVLLVVADRSASGESVEWGRGIGTARPQSVGAWIVPGKVAVVSVADLRAVPGFARGTARWIIARMVGEQGPGGPPLLLDWDGAVAARIGAHDGVPNVRLYAADGTLVLADEGDATPERVARLAAAIDGLVPGATVSSPEAPASNAPSAPAEAPAASPDAPDAEHAP
jgi:hypothetical protein